MDTALDRLRSGSSAFIAVLGLRKMGKTSLFHEWMRRHRDSRGVVFVPVQCWAWPDPNDFFREYLRLTLNATLVHSGLHTACGLISRTAAPSHLLEVAAEAARRGLAGLGEAARLGVEYDNLRARAAAYREVVRLPESIATADGVRFQFLLDEFQELTRLDRFRVVKQGFGSVYAMLREQWQSQAHCNYIVSGSAITMLRQILEEPSAPLFQHFTSVRLDPLPHDVAVAMLVEFSRLSGRRIPPGLGRSIVELVGPNPYYLQVIGEELVLSADAPEIDHPTWRRVCQRVLLESSGRLYQYHQRIHASVVGRSSVQEKILFALADGPKRGSEIAAAVGLPQSRLGAKLPVLLNQDIIEREATTYRLSDPCYRLWLRAIRRDAPNVIGPLLLGDESERNVARELAKQGVGLVYQSRASRGSFDLLAVYQAHEIGVQVRRLKAFPGYVSARDLGRMQRDAKTLGWHGVLAFDVNGTITFHPLSSGRPTKRGRRFDEQGALAHVLDVLDG